jgi:RNA polymerase sigma factor (sigma-70 family)
MQVGSDIQALLARARGGDAAAFDGLILALRPQLERLMSPYADPATAAESTSDLVQEAGLRLWQKLEQFAGGAGDAETAAKFSVWVEKLTRTIGLNAVRDRGRLRRSPPAPPLRLDTGRGETDGPPAPEPPAAGDSPSAGLLLDERSRRIREAVDRLPQPEDRVILRLHFFEGLTLRRIAERLEMGYDRVKDRLQASMVRLERELGPYLKS